MTRINRSSSSITKSINPDWSKWAIAISVALGAILEAIDASIVNVALPDIQANLGVTITEIGWIVTGYVIANAIVIPLTAWLGEQFGQKRYFIFSLVGFTIFSLSCGFAPNLQLLILFRILQGLCGGGLLTKAQAILFQTFPTEQQGIAQGLFGMGIIASAAISPILGGYLTDSIGWRWIFLINLPLGMLATIVCWLFLPKDLIRVRSPQKVDWWGIGLLAIAISSLQMFLEQAQGDDWFKSKAIVGLAIIATLALVLFVWRELTTLKPAVDLRVLRHRSLAIGSFYAAILSMALYSALFALPIFAQNVLHYTATQTAMLLCPGAIAAAVTMPILGKSLDKIDSQLSISIGGIITGTVMFQLAGIAPNIGTNDLFYLLLWRGVGTVMIFLPLCLISLGLLPKQDIPAGSGFYNLTRQLGGSIGITILTTLLARRENFHRINLSNSSSNEDLAALTSALQSLRMDANTAHQEALNSISQAINLQSAILSFEDIFKVIGTVFLFTLPLLLLLGEPKSKAFN
jgi:MFS transporter, DHA2 family, multidrug resistance protein